MKSWITCTAFLSAGLLAVLSMASAADDKETPATGLLLVDAKGKEQKLKTWEFTEGTRRLGWLVATKVKESQKKDDEDKVDDRRRRPPAKPRAEGPEALVFRDENSTDWQKGVLTLIPVERLRSIDYDNEKQTATVKVAAGAKPENDVEVTGSTRFRGTNKLTIEAEVDKGELGIASVKYFGGVPTGIRALRFPSPNGSPTATGRPAQVTVNLDGKKKATEKVVDLQILYRTGRGEKLSPILLFKKTIKLDVAKLQKLVAVESEGTEWQLTLKKGDEETLTLLDAGVIDGQQVELEGFLARVPAGYKLFPPALVTEIQFDEVKNEDKPDKSDKPEKP
jgi:hypothetical protein